MIALGLLMLLAATSVRSEAVTIDARTAIVESAAVHARQPALRFTLNRQGKAIVRLPLGAVSAAGLPLLRLHLEPGAKGVRVLLFAVFTGEDEPRPVGSWSAFSAQTVAYLGREDAWEGEVTQLVLGIEGQPGQAMELSSVSLQALDVQSLLDNLCWGWSQRSEWTLISHNLARPKSVDLVLVTPVMVAYGLAAAGLLLGAVVSYRYGVRRGLGVAVAPFLLGWLVVDGHWLVQQRLTAAQAIDTYAHRPDGARVLAGSDARMEILARRVKQRIGARDSVRILVASGSDFRGMRTAYYLYPYNVYWRRHHELPEPDALRAGDYLLLLAPTALRVEDSRLVYPGAPEPGPFVATVFSDGDVTLLRVRS